MERDSHQVMRYLEAAGVRERSSLVNNDVKLLSPHNVSLAYLPSQKYMES